MTIMPRIRNLPIVASITMVCLLAAGCEEASLNWGIQQRYAPRPEPVKQQLTVTQLARELGLTVIQPGPDVVRLQNAANTVTIFSDPYGAAYVNGQRVPAGGRIEPAGPSLFVPASLTETIRAAMRREPPVAPRPRTILAAAPAPRATWIGTVVLDAGHGGKDPGAMSRGGDREADIVLAVARHVATMLQDRGVQVLLTRDGDTFVELDDRVSFANRHRPDLFLSIHVDAARSTEACGFTVYVPRREPQPSPSRRAGDALAARLESVASVSRGVRQHEKNLRVLENTRVPAVLIELGFITNGSECRLLLRPAYQQRLAAALADGAEAHLRQNP
jgi:N-acetylmuramoyl-L-alanine amidase